MSTSDYDDLFSVQRGDPWGMDVLGHPRTLVDLGMGIDCFASAGSITTGHVLLMPRTPSKSMLEYCGSWFKLEAFISVAQQAIGGRFGQGLVFEHGLSARSTGHACGVNQAHAHFVPLASGSLTPPPHYIWTQCDRLDSERWREYLLWSVGGRTAVSLQDATVPSQILRRYVGSHFGYERWDWRKNDGRVSTERTDRLVYSRLGVLTNSLHLSPLFAGAARRPRNSIRGRSTENRRRLAPIRLEADAT
jgi:hypothetical protein